MNGPAGGGRPIELTLESLDSRQRAAYDAILAGPRGVVEGPLKVWLLSAELADRAQALGAFCRYGTGLPPVLSELAILVMGSFWKAEYEWFVHAPIAEGAGLAPAAIEALRAGRVPCLEGAPLAVYRFARELLERHEVSDDAYAFALRELGLKGLVELVGILGYYSLISMTIKAFKVPLPHGVPAVFENDDPDGR